MSAGHDHKHLDLSGASLASRVCNGDASLIMSANQAQILSQINAYLGLASSEMRSEGLSPGTALCGLCMFWWCLYLGREFRSIASSLEGLSDVKRGATEFEDGTLRSLSTIRFGFFYALRLSKAGISCMLLVAGVLWLANTTSVSGLVLRAVSLKSLFELDAVFFGALMPKKFQVRIKKLKPLRFRNSARRSQMESLLLVLFFLGMMVFTWSQLITPLSVTMQDLKREYCDGNQDFVVGVNENHGVAVTRPTLPFTDVYSSGYVEEAVRNYAFSNDSKLLVARESAIDFEKTRLETLATATTASLKCDNFDGWFLQGRGEPIPSRYGPYWWTAAAGLGLSENSTCADMAAHCNGQHSQLLRMVCSVTCECVAPQPNLLYKVQAQGCLKQCDLVWMKCAQCSQFHSLLPPLLPMSASLPPSLSLTLSLSLCLSLSFFPPFVAACFPSPCR